MTRSFTSAHIIVITDAPVGYQVKIAPGGRSIHLDRWFDKQEHEIAKSYAVGLSLGTGWAIEDTSTSAAKVDGIIIVQQLDRTHWVVLDPDDRWTIGDVDWPVAVAEALYAATESNGLGVVSVSLDGDRLVLLRPGCGSGRPNGEARA